MFVSGGSRRLAFRFTCLLFVVGCLVGQNIIEAENGKPVKRSRFSTARVNENDVIPEEIPRVNDIRDDLDLGLRPIHHGRHIGFPVSDWDVANDVDLGLRHHHNRMKGRPVAVKNVVNNADLSMNDRNLKKVPIHDNKIASPETEQEKEPITDEDLKNDVDLGLLHPHRPIMADTLSDKDIADDVDLGLKHGAHVVKPVSEDDLKENLDFDLQHEHVEDQDSNSSLEDDGEQELKPVRPEDIISDSDIRDDIDLGYKHSDNKEKEPISDNDTENSIQLHVRPQEEEETNQAASKTIDDTEALRQEQLQKLNDRISSVVKMRKEKATKMRDGAVLGQQLVMETGRRENTTHPSVAYALPQIRRKILEHLHRASKDAESFNQVVKSSPSLARKQQELERREQQQQQQTPLAEQNKAHLDNICHQYDVDGCSIPFGAPFFFKEMFTNSCYHHDICYGCGVKYGFDRKTCDYAFKGNMWKACLAKYVGNETITDPRKRTFIKAVESLKPSFNDILRAELSHVMRPSTSPEKDQEKFLHHAKLSPLKIIPQWVDLLKKKLYMKKKFSSSSDKQKLIDLMHSGKSLNSSEGNHVGLEFDNNLTVNLCEHILKNPNHDVYSQRVVLSCEEIELLACHFFDYVYFLAVRIFAHFSYHNKPEFYCGEPFVKKCLPYKH